MFPERTRRPMPILPPRPYQAPTQRRGVAQQSSNMQSFLSAFQNGDGQFDFEKLIGTAHQINGIYKQIHPLISSFLKR